MKYNIQKSDVPVEYYLNDVEKKYTYPSWQREFNWPHSYKEDLILSLLNNIDIPKIYIANIIDSDKSFIIDGSHRTKTIQEFKMNKFPVIDNDGKHIYYSETNGQKDSMILNRRAKKHFDNYKLTIITYDDIEEKECRTIFNRLQNARPMDIEDVINSYESDLVSFMREFINEKINGKTIKEYFKEIKGLSEDKTKVMSQLISWFSIIFPVEIVRKCIDLKQNAMRCITKGKKNDSPLLDDYIKKYDKDITQEQGKIFKNEIEFIINYIKSKKW